MSVYAKVWRVLDRRQRSRLVASQLIAIAIGLSTLGGITAIIPFFAVLNDPQSISHSGVLRVLYGGLGFASERQFVIALGIGFVAMLCLSNALNTLGFFAITRFSYRTGSDLHVALFDEYMHRDLLFHSRIHGAALLNNIIHEANRVATSIVQGLMVFSTNAVTSGLILISVTLVSPRVALAAVVGLGMGYVLIYLVIRRRVTEYGKTESALSSERTRIVNESLAGIRDILLAGNQEPVRTRFAAACAEIARCSANTVATAQSPRQLIECITAGGLVAAALLLSAGTGDGGWLAQLTFIGFAAYRFVPALQQMFAASVWMRADRAAFDAVIEDLERGARRRALPAPPLDERLRAAPASHISLQDISFRYAADAAQALDNVSLRIPAGAMVGFVGRNGSGKTTLADLILGLLRPDAGFVEVDGIRLTAANTVSWQAAAAYVPQTIFLADATVAENIALGVHGPEVDWVRLAAAARLARVDEFADVGPGGTGERIGERGVRLSGGQRQRIGIARALYRQARILVLDEATSALDAVAEREIIRSLATLRGSTTIVLITHRLAVVQHCDLIFEVDNGTIVGHGTFDDLMESSDRFRKSAQQDVVLAGRHS
jgi:ABC-type multidrug transport system fused ATPase/permease subunit